jgi:hypothetical protein
MQAFYRLDRAAARPDATPERVAFYATVIDRATGIEAA